jgi:hypothetical protein
VKAPQEHLDRIRRVLSRVSARAYRVGDYCHQTGDAVETRTPLDDVMEAEERAESAAALESLDLAQLMLGLDGIPEPLAAMIRSYVDEVSRQNEDRWLDWLFEEGPDPLIVMKRLFALVKVKRPRLVWKMSFRDLGKLFDETHAAFASRCMVLFGEEPAEWKKPEAARLAMQKAQLGNSNRKGGKKVLNSQC